MLTFDLPSKQELAKMGSVERMNIFRQFFAASRYNRLLIQQTLVQTALNRSLSSKMEEIEKAHNSEFFETMKKIKGHGFLDEFLVAVKEEADALQKIIEAYDKRMHRGESVK